MTPTITTDGRDIDQTVGSLSGEGSLQRVKPADTHIERVAQPWDRVPTTQESDPTYYDRPLLKEPVSKTPRISTVSLAEVVAYNRSGVRIVSDIFFEVPLVLNDVVNNPTQESDI